MRHEKGTCTASALVRRVHAMVPRSRLTECWYPRAWLPSCQSAPSHLAAFKDCPAEMGRLCGGPHVFNTAQSGEPRDFTTQDQCQELPTRGKGFGEGIGRGKKARHWGKAQALAKYACTNVGMHEIFLGINVHIRCKGINSITRCVKLIQHTPP